MVISHLFVQGDAMSLILRSLRRLWPQLVIMDSSGVERVYGPSLKDLADLFSQDELLIYKSRAAYLLWEHKGASKSTRGTLVHLLFSPGEMTAVLDDTLLSMGLARDFYETLDPTKNLQLVRLEE